MQAYLRWKYDKLTTSSVNEELPYNFTIPTVDIHTLATSSLIHCGENSLLLSITLVEHGYLGNLPENPSLAILLNTLELYYWLHLQKPSLSVEAFTKVICDLYMVRALTASGSCCTHSLVDPLPATISYCLVWCIWGVHIHSAQDWRWCEGYTWVQWAQLEGPQCLSALRLWGRFSGPVSTHQNWCRIHSLRGSQSWSLGG